MDEALVRPERVSGERLATLQADTRVAVRDALPEALDDLFKIRFPHLSVASPEGQATKAAWMEHHWSPAAQESHSVWFYFPWKQTLVRLPEEALYHELRTTRNKYLITEDEQCQFYDATIAIAGMSVGSSVLNSIVLSGGGKHMRLADHDTLSITNLNRLFASVCDLTTPKLMAAMRRVYEMNPFADIVAFPDGLSTENMDDFLHVDGKPVALFIEEMDDILLKILARRRAKELRIPVLMATDNGDNTIIDVERFDLEPDRPLFHGKADESLLDQAEPSMPIAKKVALANTIVGSGVTPRMQHSLTQVGQTLSAWPQLGNAAILSGAAISYTARRILTGAPMPSGRYEVHLDRDIDPDYATPEAVAERDRLREEFELGFALIYSNLEDPL